MTEVKTLHSQLDSRLVIHRADGFAKRTLHVHFPYLQQLVQIVPYVMVNQGWVQNLEICVVDILKHQAGSPGLRVPDYIQKLDNVCAPTDVLQDLDLSLDLRMVRSRLLLV